MNEFGEKIMALKDFVSGTLVQIIEGVIHAKKAMGELNAEISPDYSNMGPALSAAPGV